MELEASDFSIEGEYSEGWGPSPDTQLLSNFYFLAIIL